MPTGKPSEKPALIDKDGCFVVLKTNVLAAMPFASFNNSEIQPEHAFRRTSTAKFGNYLQTQQCCSAVMAVLVVQV